MFGINLEAQFLEYSAESGGFKGTIEKSPFIGKTNMGAPEIHVADMSYMIGHDDRLAVENIEGFFTLQQGEDTVIISKEQIEKLVELTK